MRQIRLRSGLCPGPVWGSLQRGSAPDVLAGFGEGKGGERKDGKRRGREEQRREYKSIHHVEISCIF